MESKTNTGVGTSSGGPPARGHCAPFSLAFSQFLFGLQSRPTSSLSHSKLTAYHSSTPYCSQLRLAVRLLVYGLRRLACKVDVARAQRSGEKASAKILEELIP